MNLQYINVGKDKLAVINIKECQDLIEYLEDLEDSLIALKRTAKIKKTVSLDEVKHEFLKNSIKEMRLSKSLTQKALAKRLETSQAFISKLESPSYRPSLAMLEKVARALKCQIEDLI